ncbi:MAG TPA: hypothetical protein VGD69_25490 [Herpetosiphonaceae bacterium]
MWLTYGLDDHGALVAVADAPRGKTLLRCPSCAGQLTAKKGQVVGHHFAHTGETCRAVDRADDAIALPLYDQFHLQLSGRELQLLLRELWATYGTGTVYPPSKARRLTQRLEARGVLAWNAYQRRGRGGYEITKLGKIPVGALSLRLFTEVQEPLLHQKHVELELAAQDARTRSPLLLDQALTDLRIYRAQWRRILSTTLYFLEVQAAGETLYKIGVTQRSVDDRVAEISQELRAVAGDVTIRVLDAWPQRGNIELYFKHRYQAEQRRLGSLTEYFAFADVRPVLADLRRMPIKGLTPLEQAVLADAPTAIEVELAAAAEARRQEQKARARSAAIAAGMAVARDQGVHVGRPAGAEATEAFLAKDTSQRVVAALRDDPGLSIRTAAQAAGVSINTVRKVAAAIGHVFC